MQPLNGVQLAERIVGRVTYIAMRLRLATALLLQQPTEAIDFDTTTIDGQQLEAYTPHWGFLVPDDPGLKATIIHELAQQFTLSSQRTPQVASILAFDSDAVQAAYHTRYGVALVDVLQPVSTSQALPTAINEHILEGLTWQFLERGETLLYQDAPGLGLHILLDGLLQVIRDEDDETLAQVGPGSLLGEVSLLTGEANSATVKALRDSDLAFLSNEQFERLSAQYPVLLRGIAVQAVERLRTTQSATGHIPRLDNTDVFTVLPASAGITSFVEELVAQLSAHGDVLLLTSEGIYTNYADLPTGALEVFAEAYEFTAWFERQKSLYDFIICVADAQYPNWTRRIIERATRILRIGRAKEDERLSSEERLLAELPHPELTPDQDLILLHDDRQQLPRGSAKWLVLRPVDQHHHVSLGNEADYARLIRHLRGRAIGIVFGGGGMRGAAHAGVLKAMAELGIVADVAGGTSAGAIIAGQFGLEWSYQRILEETKAKLMRRDVVFEITFPYAALTTGRKLNELYEEMFGAVAIEDLWVPVFTIASNVTQAKMNIMDSGSLHRAVKASTSLAGIFPPTVDTNNDLLIDGGGFNNTPADVMRDKIGSGLVIAVDIGFTKREYPHYNYGDHLNGFRWLFNRINPFRREKIVAPFIVNTMMRSNALWSIQKTEEQVAYADLVLRPPVHEYGLYDFESVEAIFEVGYNDALARLQAWLETGGMAKYS